MSIMQSAATAASYSAWAVLAALVSGAGIAVLLMLFGGTARLLTATAWKAHGHKGFYALFGASAVVSGAAAVNEYMAQSAFPMDGPGGSSIFNSSTLAAIAQFLMPLAMLFLPWVMSKLSAQQQGDVTGFLDRLDSFELMLRKALPVPAPNPAPASDAGGTAKAGVVAVLIVMALATAADAGLKAVVIAPQVADAGSDIFLDSSGSTPETILKRHWRVTAVPPTAIVPGRKQFDLTDPVKPRLMSYPGKYTVELTIVGSDGELDSTEVVIDIKAPTTADCPPPVPCPECPICPKPNPSPSPSPSPTPIPVPVPVPVPPNPAPLPKPNPPADKYGLAKPTAEIAQAVLLAKYAAVPLAAADRAAQFDAAKQQWSSEVDQLSATSQSVAAQIAAGTLKSIMDVKIDGPKTPGWQVATTALSALVLDTYTKHKSELKLSLTGQIEAPAEWAEAVRGLDAGFKAAKDSAK